MEEATTYKRQPLVYPSPVVISMKKRKREKNQQTTPPHTHTHIIYALFIEVHSGVKVGWNDPEQRFGTDLSSLWSWHLRISLGSHKRIKGSNVFLSGN